MPHEGRINLLQGCRASMACMPLETPYFSNSPCIMYSVAFTMSIHLQEYSHIADYKGHFHYVLPMQIMGKQRNSVSVSICNMTIITNIMGAKEIYNQDWSCDTRVHGLNLSHFIYFTFTFNLTHITLTEPLFTSVLIPTDNNLKEKFL